MAKTTKGKRERKYYGCKHCGSWCVVRLKTCIGDTRDGIRSDYQCKVCGGVYGTAAYGHVFIDGGDWREETGQEMPRANKERVLAMKILVTLEEQFKFRFRSKELEVVEAITPPIKDHHEALMKRNKVLSKKIEWVRKII